MNDLLERHGLTLTPRGEAVVFALQVGAVGLVVTSWILLFSIGGSL